MAEGAGTTEHLRVALEALKAALGPAYTDEEGALTLRLSHDRGMWLRGLLLRDCPLDASDTYRRQLAPPALLRQSAGDHKLELAGVRDRWPARRIAYGDGWHGYI